MGSGRAFIPVSLEYVTGVSPTYITRYLDDANQCMRVSSALEAGTVSSSLVVGDSENVSSCIELQVWVNQYNLLCNNVPFGGKKQSGIGKSRVGQSHYRGSRH
jgi:hypothetical protein